MEKDLMCEEIRCEHLVQDQWIDFRRSAYRFPDGRVFEPYYSYTRRDYAVIVASDEAGSFLCVRQFRQGIRQVTTEFPAYGCNIINCTVVGNEDVSSSAYASGICCSEHGVLINNLVYGNTSSGKQSVEATQIIVNNKYLFFFNNAFPEGLMFQKETPWKQERHDDASNVTIAESEMQDGFMPAQGSPLIDKGLEEVAVNGHEDGVVPSWTEIDIAGGQRHVRTIDIGCYEYQN